MVKHKKIKSIVFSVLILFMFAASILFYDIVSSEVKNSVHVCLYVIIPSLFGAMVCACMITQSGLHHFIGRLFSPAAKYVFRIRPDIFGVFLISNISGYPVGAKLLADLRKKGEITDREFDTYITFCYSSGPAFIAGTAAAQIYQSMFTGFIIFICLFMSNITLLLAGSFRRKIPESPKINTSEKSSLSSVIISSVNSAAAGMYQMCIMIMAFSVIKAVLIRLSAIDFLSCEIARLTGLSLGDSAAWVLSFIEISNISQFTFMDYSNLPLICALLSFGGLCVIIQVTAIASGRMKTGKFLVMRLAGSILSYLYCSAAYNIFSDRLTVSASTCRFFSSSTSALPSVILIIMSIMLISQKAMDKSRTK